MTLIPVAHLTASAHPRGWKPDQARPVRTHNRVLAQSLNAMSLTAAISALRAPKGLLRAHARAVGPSWTGGNPLVDLPRLVAAMHESGQWTNALTALDSAPGIPIRPEVLGLDLAAMRLRTNLSERTLHLGMGTDRALERTSLTARHHAPTVAIAHLTRGRRPQ